MGDMRYGDRWQLIFTGFALVFVVTTVGLAQTQDSLNATILERMAGLSMRVDKIESYQTATIVALISNLVAHVISIKTQRGRRN